MALVDTFMLRGGANHTYMTDAELSLFKRLRTNGTTTFFRTKTCEKSGCGQEIHQSKLYCSRKCYQAIQAQQK